MNSISRFAPPAARLLLGLVFFVLGLNGFLQFLPTPPAPERATAFVGALIATGYMFPLIKSVEVICGALLLSNRLVPLALEVVTAWSYRDAFAPMLRTRTAPRASTVSATVTAHAVS